MVFTFFFFRKEVWSSWEGSRKHKIYNPTLGTVCMLFENTGWFPSEKLTTTQFIHGLSMTDVWYSRVMLSSSLMHLLPVFFLLELFCHSWGWHTHVHTNQWWLTKRECTWQEYERFCFWAILGAFFLTHVAVWWQRPCSRAKMSSVVNGFCDTGRQGGVLLELHFGWWFGKSRGD